ncbi:DUF2950 family protein [Dyella sp. C11]|uniref:DUF2950 family protein n=1 Tax=Dyella sp. C11 TaxID=2126991 RepID=UPI000D659D3C|nr:DUF2950 family protein [Dyella sp. C11]
MNSMLFRSHASTVAPRVVCGLAMAIAATLGLCQSGTAFAQSMPQYFATPEQAGRALVDAVRTNDDPMIASILGPDGVSALHSGDTNEDASAQKAFVRKYDAMHRWAMLDDGSEVLYVGADNYAYPFPLKKDGDAGWRFDGLAGTDEIIARRIGSHELLAMDAVSAMAQAEEGYREREHQYTARIISKPGTHDGLYWAAADGEMESPLGNLRNLQACPTCAEGSQVFDGYVFRVIAAKQDGKNTTSYMANGKMTGGFAVVATPVAYGDTGIMSFLIDRDGVLYEKNLGTTGSKQLATMQAYDPKDGWTVAE